MQIAWRDYYRVLGVDRKASEEQIHRAFRDLARKYHSDINPGNDQSEEQFWTISKAFEVLSDRYERRISDEQSAGRFESRPEIPAAERNRDDGQERSARVDFPLRDARAACSAAATVSRMNVAVILAVGLPTFFMTFVTTDSPVHGRTEWGPLDWLISRADQWRPAPSPFHIHGELYQIALVYGLMLLALLALALPRPRRLLEWITVVGAPSSIALIGPRSCRGFGWLFYGRYTQGPFWDGTLRGVARWQGFQFEFPF